MAKSQTEALEARLKELRLKNLEKIADASEPLVEAIVNAMTVRSLDRKDPARIAAYAEVWQTFENAVKEAMSDYDLQFRDMS